MDRKEYLAKYREEHKEQARLYKIKNAQSTSQYFKSYYAMNKDNINSRNLANKLINKEAYNAQHAEYMRKMRLTKKQ